MRWRAVAGGVLVLVLAGAVAVAGAGADAPCPGCNVVLVSVDTLRADHLGTYGYQRNTSPYIDRLARRSTVYENVYAASVHTLTSHYSMFTGLYPTQHGVRPGSVNGSTDERMLAQAFQAAGYQTYSHNGGANLRADNGFAKGFDRYHSDYVPQMRDPTENFDAALREIGSVIEGDQPFFIFYHTYNVHSPYNPPEQYDELFPGANESIQRRMMDARRRYLEGPTPNLTLFDWRYHWLKPRLEERPAWRRHLVSQYDAEIRQTDAVLRRLMRLLERKGVADETVVVITSDHGEQFYDHGLWFHWTLFREVQRVPLIIHLPGQQDGRRIGRFVSLIDLPTTLLELVGIRGRRFREQSRGTPLPPFGPASDRSFIAASHYSGQRAIIRLRDMIKYYNSSYTGDELLYNLSADLNETDPLNNTDLLREMRDYSARIYRRLDRGGRDQRILDQLDDIGYVQ